MGPDDLVATFSNTNSRRVSEMEIRPCASCAMIVSPVSSSITTGTRTLDTTVVSPVLTLVNVTGDLDFKTSVLVLGGGGAAGRSAVVS